MGEKLDSQRNVTATEGKIMKYDKTHKSIPYSVQYNEYFDNWDWSYRDSIGNKSISGSGTSSTRSDAEQDAQWSIDREFDWL